MNKWYRIKARDMNIFKPDGKVIKFWLYRKNKKEVKELVLKSISSVKLGNSFTKVLTPIPITPGIPSDLSPSTTLQVNTFCG